MTAKINCFPDGDHTVVRLTDGTLTCLACGIGFSSPVIGNTLTTADLLHKYREIIEKYTRHYKECPAPGCFADDYECDCGLDDAMKAVGFEIDHLGYRTVGGDNSGNAE